LLAAFRLTVDDVECWGGNFHGPLCELDGVDGLLFVVENTDGLQVVTESWLDRAIVSFDVHSLSEEEEGEDSGEDADEEADEQEPDEQEED